MKPFAFFLLGVTLHFPLSIYAQTTDFEDGFVILKSGFLKRTDLLSTGMERSRIWILSIYSVFLERQAAGNWCASLQGLLGLGREAVATYLSDKPELAKRIRSGKNLSAFEITELYNQKL